jgi:serine/threonine-protein kinase
MSDQYSPVPADTVEGERDLQQRLGRFSRAIAIVFIVMFLVSMLTHAVTGGELAEGESTVAHQVLHLVLFLVALAAWLRCRGRQMTRRTLDLVDAGVTIAACWLVTSLGVTGKEANFGVVMAFSLVLGVAYIVVGRSIVVPSSQLRTLWISAVAVLPTIAFFVLRAARIEFADRRIENIFIAFAVGWLAFAVIVAAANSRQLFGLRATIREIGKLGQYTLDAKIGEGGMGAVYRATHAMLRRPAAIKLLPPERSSPADVARFEREVQLTTRLSHPNTISIFDYGRTPEGVFYYAMEYLDGIDLDRLVTAGGPLDPARAIHLLVQICGSLAEAHALGLVHRDIKPANIVVTERVDEPDVIKVLDFGLVRTLEREQATSTAGAVVGTPLYLAPESITKPESIDPRADIYAVGGVAYFLVTGSHVFEAATVVELCSKHLSEQPQPPSERLGRAVPADLEAVIVSCLAKNRDDRPASAAALRSALLACAAGREPGATRDLGHGADGGDRSPRPVAPTGHSSGCPRTLVAPARGGRVGSTSCAGPRAAMPRCHASTM